MKYVLYGHGTSYNHGAEAIVKTTVKQIRQYDNDAYIVLSTHFAEHDREFGVDVMVDQLIEYDRSWLEREKQAAASEKKYYAQKMYREALEQIQKNTICLAVGGDNYCYPNWHRQAVFHETAKQRGGLSVLWRCSIQEEALTDELQEILREHDWIIVRESATQEVLLKKGITNTVLLPDTAFDLEPCPTVLPEIFFGCSRVIGINLSPLILRYSNQEETLRNSFVDLITYLLENTDFCVCLIPHVTISVDNDLEALQCLYHVFEDNERVAFVNQNLSAAEYKYIIARCYMLLCARTHASIAAYSSFVPTLVIGYSIKSIGIARDLQCSEYVLDAKTITSDLLLTEFEHLRKNYDVVKHRLEQVIPEYSRMTKEMGTRLPF